MAKLVGKIYYQSHSATPTVIGDFERMKSWPGEPDGEAEGPLELGDGHVFGFTAFDLASPFLFVEDDVRVTLLVPEGSYGRSVEPPEGDLLRRLLDDASEDGETTEIGCPSGALVITVAYNATPAEGADTSDLDERCVHDEVPRLPMAPPEEATYAKECAIVPVRPGTYAVVVDELHGYERCQLVWLRPSE